MYARYAHIIVHKISLLTTCKIAQNLATFTPISEGVTKISLLLGLGNRAEFAKIVSNKFSANREIAC